MNKKFFTKEKIIIVVLSCFILFILFGIFSWMLDTKQYSSSKYIRVIGNYTLEERNIGGGFGGPGNNYIAICTNYKKCSEWNVKGIQFKDKKIYSYFSPVMYSIEEMLSIFKDSTYSIFDDGLYYSLNGNINNAKIFGIFTQESMNFYSINDLKQLPQEQQKVLLELKAKPRFIFE